MRDCSATLGPSEKLCSPHAFSRLGGMRSARHIAGSWTRVPASPRHSVPRVPAPVRRLVPASAAAARGEDQKVARRPGSDQKCGGPHPSGCRSRGPKTPLPERPPRMPTPLPRSPARHRVCRPHPRPRCWRCWRHARGGSRSIAGRRVSLTTAASGFGSSMRTRSMSVTLSRRQHASLGARSALPPVRQGRRRATAGRRWK